MSKRRAKAAQRPTQALEFRAEADGVTRLEPLGFSSFIFCVKCTQCGCVRRDVRFIDEDHAVEGSRGTANFVMKCKDCSRQCKASYVDTFFDRDCDDYSEWQRVLTFHCRGCAVDAGECDAWRIIAASKTTHEWDAAEDFFEYDEDLERPVTVSGLEYRVVAT